MSAQGASLQPENRLRAARDAAVIDVGSNSVRLVLYRLEGRAIWAVYNEKVLAGLGRDLGSTGRLSPAGVDTAMTALRRFRAVLDAAAPDAIFTAATAAVREAVDGVDFIDRVQGETGLTLRVLSGQEEARYAALGVLAGSPHGEGVVGDLGGASLELVRLSPEGPVEGATLALGPFALAGVRPDRVRDEIERRLAPHAPRFRAAAFQAVGGAWRNLALLHMRMSGYPLKIVHQYEMNRADALDAARFLSRQSKTSLERIEGISRKRLETLPHAAMVLEALIEQLGIERIAVSAYGLREGLLFESMAAETQSLDPLVEGCAALTGRQGVDETLGPTLEAWLAPVFDALSPEFEGREALLRAAACRLADLGARLHPDHRADLVFEQVLRAPVAGQTHAERAFLAVAAFSRHTSASSVPEGVVVSRLLSERQLRRARALGAAVRLGCDLSGRSSVLLAQSRLGLKDDRLVLSAADGWSDMLLGEQTARRATQLAGLLGVKLEIRRN
ncbi:MAG: Ppx/GppA family phosphatase [Caulobacterales bacterium]|nr:Ppx/GppA family phosphatase [Caulobacterales bacterium]